VATVCALVGIGLSIATPFLPLHLIGSGYFSSIFHRVQGMRLTIALAVALLVPVLLAVLGLIALARRHFSFGAGLFMGASMIAFTDGITEPLFSLPRFRPLLLASVHLLAASVLFLAGWASLRAAAQMPTRWDRPVNPPPPPVMEDPRSLESEQGAVTLDERFRG
jgi:hypothetical protein